MQAYLMQVFVPLNEISSTGVTLYIEYAVLQALQLMHISYSIHAQQYFLFKRK